jgi:S1-C subfamily serine protease
VFVALALGQAIGYVLGHRTGSFARRLRLGGLDAALGAGFGIAVTLVSYWLIGSLLAQSSFRPLARELRKSELLSRMNDVAKPPDVLSYLSQYLNTSGFPQVFAGLPRPVGPPVKLPSSKRAQRAIAAADQSTVRVVVPACGGTQLGSGWVASPGIVVSNAHVVAGGSRPSVQAQGDGTAGATVVLFDRRTDVSVLRVAGLDVPPLPLDDGPLERGAPGATLGYPGAKEGRLVASRAAVQSRFVATGRDIYGRSSVRREVYELRAAVRQGDSGGPFVTPGGQVAGMVFAASTTDANTGYALTGAEIHSDVTKGESSNGAVSTGPCTH